MPKLLEFPVHLGLGATAMVEPVFTGDLGWYEDYVKRHEQDGVDGRLVSLHTFDTSWDSWEVHPNGAEVVICAAGSMTLIQELNDGSHAALELQAGDYAINAPGVWHTADIAGYATAVFITAGVGTQHRSR